MPNTAELIESIEQLLEHEVLIIEALDEAIAKLSDFQEELEKQLKTPEVA